MLRLGNIDYSNCYPIHEPVLSRERPAWLRVVDGAPSELNRQLAEGQLDIAPGSSIELARHNSEYVALRGLCIGCAGPVESILLASRVPLKDLAGRTVALPTASASSRCLARILLELRLGVTPIWVDFDQSAEDPLAAPTGSAERSVDRGELPAAALYIGDIALKRATFEGELRFDLGREWAEWTGLPFVFALWMVRDQAAGSEETRDLHRTFIAQRDGLAESLARLASGASPRYGFPAHRLIRYWSHIRYDLDESMLRGLRRFLDLAVELGEAPARPELRFVP